MELIPNHYVSMMELIPQVCISCKVETAKMPKLSKFWYLQIFNDFFHAYVRWKQCLQMMRKLMSRKLLHLKHFSQLSRSYFDLMTSDYTSDIEFLIFFNKAPALIHNMRIFI